MYDNDNNDYIDYEENIPEYFETFDEALKKGINPGYFESDELCEIIDIYFSEWKIDEAKFTIDYALKLYPNNEDLVYEILSLLNDYEAWNDLLTLCEQYSKHNYVWNDAHKLSALLHLGMEEDAFQCFKIMKSKYAENKEDLSTIYQAMGEALFEVDLFDASIEVIDEAISILGESIDFLWVQLQGFAELNDKENVIGLGNHIQNINPMDAEIWNGLGDTYRDIGEMEKAVEAYEFAQSLGLKDPSNLLNAIYAYEKNGNYIKALQKAEEYLIEYADSYLVNLLAIDICSEMEDWAKGIEFIESAIRLEPYVVALYLYLCKFYLKLGETVKAIKALEEGIKNTEDVHGELKEQLKKLKNI